VNVADQPRRLGHPALLLVVALSLLAVGVVVWVLGYLEAGRQNGDRLAELGAGIVAGAVVSFAFWLVDRAVEDRERRREARDTERHERLIESVRATRTETAPTTESAGPTGQPSIDR
jgi:hypothetical protein